MRRTVNIAASVLLGALVLTRLALAMLPAVEPSPIAVDGLRVLIVAEQTGGEFADEADAAAMHLRDKGVQVQVRDDDADVSIDLPWVRDGMKLVEKEPWVVIGSPNGGYSMSLPPLDRLMELVEGLQ